MGAIEVILFHSKKETAGDAISFFIKTNENLQCQISAKFSPANTSLMT
jgi:hypothetical protein